MKNHGLDGELTPDAERFLESLPYPGNIRQLRNIIENALIISGGGRLDTELFRQSQTGKMKMSNSFPDSESAVNLEGMTLEDLERKAIEEAVQRCDGNLSQAALELGITRQALYRRMEKYDLGK